MSYVPVFTDTERTSAQRSESVKWAVGVTMSQGQSISPRLTALYKRYIAGEIDQAYIDNALELMYPNQPTTDPRYQPGSPTDRYYPEPVEAAPTQQYQVVDMAQAWELG